MPRSRLTELAAIEILQAELERTPLAARSRTKTILGIGDDAAVIGFGAQNLVWSIDTSAEGSHFDRKWLGLEQAAARATTAALSDLAAMGASPIAALCALSVPQDISAVDLRNIARGQRQVAGSFGCPVLGGNLCRGDRVAFTTTVLGSSPNPLRRDGARPGDQVWLIGDVGLAAAGLRLLQARADSRGGPRLGAAAKDCVRAWQRPTALIARGRQLAGRAHSLIDVSDGLASEARHLARASHVRIQLSEQKLRQHLAPSLDDVARRLGVDAVHLMLYGGEDYVLLATGPASKRPRWARVIGSVTKGEGAWLEPIAGAVCTPLGAGFDHLTS